MRVTKSKTKWLKIIIYLFTAAILIFNIYNSITSTEAFAYFVDGRSMEPTLHSKQLVFSAGKDFSRGDIVTAHLPDVAKVNGRENIEIIIKRIIGVPNDIVEITPNGICVNGELYNEPYLSEDIQKDTFVSGSAYSSVTLSDSQYFLLGDNRGNSYDSRYFGPVEKDLLCSVQTENFAEGFCEKYLLACDCFSLIEVLVKKLIPAFKV